MTFFPWSEQYSVGVEQIDAEHKQLVAMLNTLYEAMYQGKGKDSLDQILQGLIRYCQTHFASEERLMRMHGYPEYHQHKTIHRKMAQQVLKLQDEFQSGRLVSPIQISNFLKDWLSKHILGTDMKYASFFQDKGVK